MIYTQDPDYRPDPAPAPRPLDVISAALGAGPFVRSHRFGDLCFETPMGRSPRLSVSRYYYDLDPPVVVDFFKEIKHGDQEFQAKRAYFSTRGIRYILAMDEWDEEAIRGRVTPVEEAPPTVPLVTAPRKSKSRNAPAPPRAS